MANENGNGSRYPSWKWLTGILVGLLIVIGGYSLSDVRSEVKTLHDKKVDKDAYYRDIDRIGKTMDEMDKKLDRILAKGTR